MGQSKWMTVTPTRCRAERWLIAELTTIQVRQVVG
jgi:hypothetical protein